MNDYPDSILDANEAFAKLVPVEFITRLGSMTLILPAEAVANPGLLDLIGSTENISFYCDTAIFVGKSKTEGGNMDENGDFTY